MTVSAHRKTILIAAVLAFIGNALAWFIHDNLFELVARQQHVILGRYSANHFYWNVIAGIVTIVAFIIVTPFDPRIRRRRVFALVTFLFIGFLTAVAADGVLRLYQPRWYEIDRLAYRRPAGASFDASYTDVPLTERNYPVRRPGYPRMAGPLTVDANGFRNAAIPASCDVLAVGDSFVEGSRIPDDRPWPVLLAKATGLSVYNLGMSGYSPQHSLAALRDFGLALRPRLIIVMLYEGNDFRASGKIEPPRIGLRQIIGTSPIFRRTEHFVYHVIGAFNSDADIAALDVLDWQPLAIPAGLSTRYYSFVPKQIDDLLNPPDQFIASPEFKVVTDTLAQIRAAAESIDAQLAIAYSPVTAHVVLQLAADRIPPEKFHAFMKVGTRRKLPPPDQLIPSTLAKLDTKETAVAAWCAQNGIEFISLTSPLRQAAASGRQPYYTYDQHWSPDGHEVAAGVIAEHCLRRLTPTPPPPRPVANAETPPSGQPTSDGG